MTKKNTKSGLKKMVESLPEIYQPIYKNLEFSENISRVCDDRLDSIILIYNALVKKVNRPLRVLDLGAAQGYFSLCLAEIGATVKGVDHLDKNIAVCKKLASEFKELDVSFHCGRIEEFIPEIKRFG